MLYCSTCKNQYPGGVGHSCNTDFAARLATEAQLRSLAEKARSIDPDLGVPNLHDFARFRRSCDPQTILSILDRLDALEKLAEAARKVRDSHIEEAESGADISDELIGLDIVLAKLDGTGNLAKTEYYSLPREEKR